MIFQTVNPDLHFNPCAFGLCCFTCSTLWFISGTQVSWSFPAFRTTAFGNCRYGESVRLSNVSRIPLARDASWTYLDTKISAWSSPWWSSSSQPLSSSSTLENAWILQHLVARANIRNWNPYFYSASGRFAWITWISDSHESPDSRESCESIRANHATKLQQAQGPRCPNRKTLSQRWWIPWSTKLLRK